MSFDLRPQFMRCDAASFQLPSSSSGIYLSKGMLLLFRYARNVVLWFLYLRLLHWPRLSYLRLLVISLTMLISLGAQGGVMTLWYRLDAWKKAVHVKQRHLLPVYCLTSLLSAYVTLFQLISDEPIMLVSLCLGILWLFIWNEQESMSHGLTRSSDIPNSGWLSEWLTHLEAVARFMKQQWRWYASFGSCIVLFCVFIPAEFPESGRILWRLMLDLPGATAVWVSGFVCYHDVLNSRYGFGNPTMPETMMNVLAMLNNESGQIIKRYAMSYLKWIAQMGNGNGFGEKFRKSLFDRSTTPTLWNGCTKNSLREIDEMCRCLGRIEGSTTVDVSHETLRASKTVIIRAAQRVQHKYVLLSHCLGYLSGMLSAAIVEDRFGAAKFGDPSIGEVITRIFEGHALLKYFIQAGGSTLEKNWYFNGLPQLQSLLVDFERICLTIWSYYGRNIFTQVQSHSRHLSEYALSDHIKTITHPEP